MKLVIGCECNARFDIDSVSRAHNPNCDSGPSEFLALHYLKKLGVAKRVLVREVELLDKYPSSKIPEACVKSERGIVSTVEVKRIVSNQFERFWNSTIRCAMSKIDNNTMLTDFKVKQHHIVFVVPVSLPRKTKKKITKNIIRYCTNEAKNKQHCDLKVVIHTIFAADHFFSVDRIGNICIPNRNKSKDKFCKKHKQGKYLNFIHYNATL